MNSQRKLIQAAMIVDGIGTRAAPGAVLVEGGRILAAGAPEAIERLASPPENPEIINLPNSVVIPALVNAHCHLDLSHIGPLRWERGGEFADWVHDLRARRAATDQEIAASVKRGVEMSHAGGTAIIGDVAGVRSLAPIAALRAGGMPGVSYLEVFGQGRSQNLAIEKLQQAVRDCQAWQNGVALGVQPHAPYSCGMDVYRAAVDLDLPLSTHLAETIEELTFVRDGAGPLADMLKNLGVWDETITGTGLHPIDHLAPLLRQVPCVAAHLNYIEPRHLEMLADWPITVAYCPRASAYFGHPRPEGGWPRHQYRQMLDAGINVALGTDSIVCLDTPDRLSVLDDMRFLFRRDGADPTTLLRMGTVNGARGLGFDPNLCTLSPGAIAGLLAIDIDPDDPTDLLEQMMANDEPPRWILGPASFTERVFGCIRR